MTRIQRRLLIDTSVIGVSLTVLFLASLLGVPAFVTLGGAALVLSVPAMHVE